MRPPEYSVTRLASIMRVASSFVRSRSQHCASRSAEAFSIRSLYRLAWKRCISSAVEISLTARQGEDFRTVKSQRQPIAFQRRRDIGPIDLGLGLGQGAENREGFLVGGAGGGVVSSANEPGSFARLIESLAGPVVDDACEFNRLVATHYAGLEGSALGFQRKPVVQFD